MAEQTLNIPQIIAFIIISGLVLRWLLSKPSPNTAPPPSAQARGYRFAQAQVDQVAQMFPQLSRRDIMWDLQRNGANVAATTERVLSGRALDTPPASFQPPVPSASTATAPTASTTARSVHPDLITRYNLSSKLDAPSSASTSGSDTNYKSAWSQDRQKRQQNLKDKREAMILEARRKMLDKERSQAAGTHK